MLIAKDKCRYRLALRDQPYRSMGICGGHVCVTSFLATGDSVDVKSYAKLHKATEIALISTNYSAARGSRPKRASQLSYFGQ